MPLPTPRPRPSALARPAAVLAMLAGAAAASAQCGAIKLTPTTKVDSERFGGSMTWGLSNGDQRLLVGAEGFDGAPFFDTGKVYLMAKFGNQWGELTSLTKPEATANGDLFGHSVGYSDPYMIVGCPGHLAGSGKAYIYERFGSTWTVMGAVTHSQAAQKVGESVAIDGGWAIVGAPQTDFDGNPSPGNNNEGAGAAFILRRNADGTWSTAQTIFNNGFQSFYINSHLGAAVALKGALAVVGVPDGTITAQGTASGWIQVYRRNASNQWVSEGDVISAAAGRSFTGYGSAVATDGTRVIVGAPTYPLSTNLGDPANAGTGGAAFVMKLSGGQWVAEDRLLAPAPASGSGFGSAVAISGDRAVVAAPADKKAYAYRRLASGNWVLDRVYSDEDAAAGGAFASAVAIGSGNIFIGDAADDAAPTTDNGAVYLKPLPAGYSTACEGAADVATGNSGGCTLESTLDGYAPCAASGSGPGPAAWMAWTPACSGNVIIDTFGSDFDTVLSIHDACPEAGDAHLVVCNDDGFPSPERDSLLTFNYTAGTRYLIRVGGYGPTAKGDFVLRINEWQTPTNNACSSPATATRGVKAFKTCLATTDGPIDDAGCTNDEDIRNDVWFKYTAISGGACTISTAGSAFDTVLQVFGGLACPASNAQALACNDDTLPNVTSSVTLGTVAGQNYLIRVGGFSGAVGDATLTIAPACPCDYNGVNGTDLLDIFDYLEAWFAGSPSADFNGAGGTDLLDIFDFLGCWFSGCA